MTLIKYNPIDEYVPTSWNSILDSFFKDNISERGMTKFSPSVDIAENEDQFEIHMAVPGMKKGDFNIEIQDNTLMISGERKWKEEKKEKNFHRIESQYGSFKRSFTLPDTVNPEKIDAVYNEGVLEIVLPKDEKKLIKNTIKVK